MRRLWILLALFLAGSLPLWAAGENVWQFGYGGPTAGDTAYFEATATDTSGNVLVTGYFTGSVSFGGSTLVSPQAGQNNIVVAKYSSAGAHVWSFSIGSTTDDKGFGIGTDSSGNVYVTGIFTGTVDFDPGAGTTNLTSSGPNTDIFVLKLSSSGTFVWAKRFGGTGNEVGLAIAVMADGTFAITGSYGNFGNAVDFGGGPMTPVGGPDIFIAKYDSAGTYLWMQSVGGTSTDSGNAIAIDPAGEVAITGSFKNTITLKCATMSAAGSNTRDALALKYNTNGVLLWARRIGGTTDDTGYGIALSATGEAVVTGDFNGTINLGGSDRTSTGGQDIWLAKYDTNGLWLWDVIYGNNEPFGDLPRALALDASGNIAITGQVFGHTDFGGGGDLCGGGVCGGYDVFALKVSNSGGFLWSHRFTPTPDSGYDEHGYGAAFDTSGNAFVVGEFPNQINLGGGNLTNPAGPTGHAAFIGKFNP